MVTVLESATPQPTAYSMYRPWQDNGARCVYCRWVDVIPTGGLGCLCPQCLYGQASRDRSCCSFEREPGSDDELG